MKRKKETTPRFRMKPTLEELAVQVLKQTKKPMHYRQVFTQIIAQHPLKGNSPEKTFYSVLYRSKRIQILGKGMVKLKNV